MNNLINIKKLASGAIKSTVKMIALKLLLGLLVVVVGMTAVFKAYSYASARYACHIQWQESAIEYKYTLRGGCLLKRGGGWIPSGNFRVQ